MPRVAKTKKPVYRRKKRVFKRRYKKPSIGKLALRLFERKKNEQTIQEVGISTLGGWMALSNHMLLSQGDSYAALEGHMVRASGISVRGFFKNNATTTTCMRYGIMHLPSGNSIHSDWLSGNALFETSTGNVDIASANTATKMTARFNRDRYRAKYERRIVLAANSSTDGKDVHFFKIWIPLNGLRLIYDGSGVLPQRNIFSFYAFCALGNNDESLGELVEATVTTTFYYVDP